MNKKLIALAVAGACVAPAALAQTANPVTLYGRVHVTLESVEAKGGTAIPRRTRVEDNSSLFGIRGTEDLGGGLKAFFQLETGFRPDQNNTTPTSGVAQAFAARNSGVGLQGGWGSLLLGRWDTPYKTATTGIDPYGDVTIAGITGVLNHRTNFDRRDQNAIQYWSPTWGGIAVRLLLTANEGKTATASPYDSGASISYTSGPVHLFATVERHKDQSAATNAGPAAAAAGQKETGEALGGAFTFGPMKVGAQYQRYKKTARTNEKAWMLNAVYTMGKNQIIGQYMEAKDGGALGSSPQPNCDSWSLGYRYNFSRRTDLNAGYVRVTNNAAATCGFGANNNFGASTLAAGQDPRGAFIGIRHLF